MRKNYLQMAVAILVGCISFGWMYSLIRTGDPECSTKSDFYNGYGCEGYWSIIGRYYFGAHLIIGFLIASVLFLTVWFYASKKDGVVKGGILGLIPAFVLFWLSWAIWPVLGILAYFNRNKLALFYRKLFDVENKE